MLSNFDVAESLSIGATSYATEAGSSWPLVTIPDFELRTRKARQMSGAEQIMFSPLFPKDRQTEWVNYTQNNSAWILEGLVLNGYQDTDPGPVPLQIQDIPNAQPGGLDDLSHSAILDDYIAALW